MTQEDDDKLEQVRHEHWKRKAQEADRRIRQLNFMLSEARKVAYTKGTTGLDVMNVLTKPDEDIVRDLCAPVWDAAYAQGIEDERQAAAVDIPEYRNPSRKNPYRTIRIGKT